MCFKSFYSVVLNVVTKFLNLYDFFKRKKYVNLSEKLGIKGFLECF